MAEIQAFLALLASSALGMLAVVIIVVEKRARQASAYTIGGSESKDDVRAIVAMEGQRACPRCGMGNSWTQRECISCGASLG
ncbi:MAG TPA: hypothetical protein VKA85_11405 [Candidatus Limnocylindrales bacterium]|nr:hypothetical protein [Candidatus Limnocylindrales bacterium]